VPVIAIAGLDSLLAYTAQHAEFQAEQARLLDYRRRYGVNA